MVDSPETQPRGRGRPAVSSRAAIERIAMGLFLTNGYDETTIQDIADACGVSRTSVIRYWGSKADIVWADFDEHTHRLGRLLRGESAAVVTAEPVMDRVHHAVVANFAQSATESRMWLERFAVLDSTPTLAAEEAAHWLTWAETIARFVAEQRGVHAGDVVPQAIGGAVQAAFLAVLRKWLNEGAADLTVLLPQLAAELGPVCAQLERLIEDPEHPATPG